MREKTIICVTVDVSVAHRQVPIDERDWCVLGCWVVPRGDVYVNAIRTTGFASASCYWSRMPSALGRISKHLVVSSGHTWHVLVATCYHLSWSRAAGLDTISWVGFKLFHRTRMLGISRRRAEWFVSWKWDIALS